MGRIIAFALLLGAAACTRLDAVPLAGPGSGFGEVAPGDRVLIRTRQGEELDLVVTRVEPDALEGRPPPPPTMVRQQPSPGLPPSAPPQEPVRRVARHDITSLEMRRLAPVRTGLLASTPLVLLGLLLLVAIAIAPAAALGAGPS
jgi:hypothetical protein